MKHIKNFWVSVKRNPVINAFLVAIMTQVFQDSVMGNIDWSHFWGYLFMVFLAVGARMFTVPEKEHIETVENLQRELNWREGL